MQQDSEASQSARDYPTIALLIDGEWISDRAAQAQVTNPSDDSVLGSVPAATEADLDRMLEVAQRAFSDWRKTPPLERSGVLRRTASLLRERIEQIAPVITLEQGKLIDDARREVRRAATFLEWDAEQLQRLNGRLVPSPEPMRQMVVREPVGPVAAFTPWNVPLSAPARKLGGAIAAGCSVIIKPAGETPGSVCVFAQCFLDAGLPPGVLQVAHGRASMISERLIRSPIIRAITLTGSVEVGKTLTHLAAEGVKPVLMELGGHAPVLIDADVDPERVAALAADAKFRMAGQLCVSPSRFLIHRDSYDRFVDAFARRARTIKVGDGFASDTQMGPVANAKRVETMEALVADAEARGAKVAAGGTRVGNRGSFFAPTVLIDVPRDADVMRLEPFGPLAACLPVDDMDDALAVANSLEVGLASYIFTNDDVVAQRLAAALESGSVSINNFATPGADAPFGGYKESGIGREGGEESLDSYTVIKTITQRSERL